MLYKQATDCLLLWVNCFVCPYQSDQYITLGCVYKECLALRIVFHFIYSIRVNKPYLSSKMYLLKQKKQQHRYMVWITCLYTCHFVYLNVLWRIHVVYLNALWCKHVHWNLSCCVFKCVMEYTWTFKRVMLCIWLRNSVWINIWMCHVGYLIA